MSGFTTLPDLRPMQDGKSWVLTAPCTYWLSGEDCVTVPRGFETDFASTPFFVWWFIPPWGTHGQAAIVHDWMYWNQTTSRAEADQVFLDAMAWSGNLFSKRYAMWLAVRLCGWFAWWKNRMERKLGVDKVHSVLPQAWTPTQPRGLDFIIRKLFARKAA